MGANSDGSCSFRYTVVHFFNGSTIQYSRTPDSRYRGNLMGVIHPTASGRYYFYDKVRSSRTSAVCQLVGITDDGNIRFHPVFIISVQINCKWSQDRPYSRPFLIQYVFLKDREYRKQSPDESCLAEPYHRAVRQSVQTDILQAAPSNPLRYIVLSIMA